MNSRNNQANIYREACDTPQTGLLRITERLRNFTSLILLFILKVRHPGTLKTLSRPLTHTHDLPCARLKPLSDLKSQAFGWPIQNFSPENSVKGKYGTEPWLSLVAGDMAVDFILKDENGNPHQLSELLKTAPVVLTFGMYTCPAYQISRLEEAKLVKQFHKSIHFVHIYTIEPHPKSSCSPDTGKPWELPPYSKYHQAYNYEDRLNTCKLILSNHPECQKILIDSFDETGLINPVWSTYGPAPRAAFLIRPDGIIDTSQLWFSTTHLSSAIHQLLKELKMERV